MQYRPLPTGTHGLSPDAVANDQRERLQRALLELIAEKGYRGVRIADLARLSRVSQPTFYSLYEDKEELLISAYLEMAGRVQESVAESYSASSGVREGLRKALTAFGAAAVAEPQGISLVVLGAFGAGQRVLDLRRETIGELERLLAELRLREAGQHEAYSPSHTDLTVKLLMGGLREVTATRLCHGREAEIKTPLADELSAWASCYPVELPTNVPAPLAAPAAQTRAALDGAAVSERALQAHRRLPRGRNSLSRRVVRDSQRERIVDAIAEIVAERGLGALTVPEIARRANVSHQTFYAIYRSKHEAFVGAQKVGLHQALQVTRQAWEAQMPDWPLAIAAGLRALIDYLIAEPAHARLTIVDTFGAGPDTIEVREQMLAGFATYFDARHHGEPPQDGHAAAGRLRVLSAARPSHAVAVEAVLGGCWQVLHYYVESGRTAELPELAPQLAYLMLTPFVGPEAAADAAAGAPASAPA